MPKFHLTRRLETDLISPVLLAVLLLRGDFRFVICILVSVLIHECGHLFWIWHWHIPLMRCTLSVFGANIHIGGLVPYERECVLLLFGSVAQLLCAALLVPVMLPWGHGVLLFCTLLLSALFNLLPLSTLDGGRVLFCLIARRLDPSVAHRILRMTDTAVLCLCWAVGAGIFYFSALRLPGGFAVGSSLFFISLFFLMALTKNEKNGD